MNEKNSARDALIELTSRIIHSYFGESQLDLLLSLLAQDVFWLGAGKTMSASGQKCVSSVFHASEGHLIPCEISDESYRAKELTPGLWLTEGSCQLRTTPSYKIYLQEYQRCSFIFRKTSKEQGPEWEIVYIHNSIAYNELKDHELFAWTEGMRNYKRIHQPDNSLLSMTDKGKLLQLFHKVYGALPEEMQEVLLLLAQLRVFTVPQAEFFCRNLASSHKLLTAWERNPFLAFQYDTGQYNFHPGFARFLQQEFTKHPRPWRRKMLMRICDCYLQEKNYKEAFRFAMEVKDSMRLLRAIRGGGLKVLYFQPVDTILDVLHHDAYEKWNGETEACLMVLLYVNLSSGPRSAAAERSSYLHTLKDTSVFSTLDRAALLVLEGLEHMPGVEAMLPYFQKAAVLCRECGQKLPYDYMRGVTQGVFGQLIQYWRTPGKLAQENKTLQKIYACCSQIIDGCNGALWSAAVIAEEQYLLGNLMTAKELMRPFVHSALHTEDQQDRAIISLFLLPRIALFEKNMGDFAHCQKVVRKLLPVVKDDLSLTDLKVTSAFVSCLLEELSDKQVEIYGQMESLNRHPSLYDTFMSLRHRILLTMHKYNQLQLVLDPQTLSLESAAAPMRKLYDSILLASVEEHLGKMDEAMKFFQQALEYAKPDGIIMPFAEHAPFLSQCFERARMNPDYEAFIKDIEKFSIKQVPVHNPLDEMLTPRERFIVKLVQQGKTNQEIASQLNIAEITVKKQLSHLYKLFGVTNRTGLIYKKQAS